MSIRLDYDKGLEEMLGKAFEPTQAEARAMLADFQGVIPERHVWALFGSRYNYQRMMLPSWPGKKGLDVMERRLIWFIWSLYFVPQNLASLVSLVTWGRVGPAQAKMEALEARVRRQQLVASPRSGAIPQQQSFEHLLALPEVGQAAVEQEVALALEPQEIDTAGPAESEHGPDADPVPGTQPRELAHAAHR